MYYILYKKNFTGGKKASRALLDAALRQYCRMSGLTLPATGFDVHETEKGKPYVDDFDNFSVSHTGDAWAVLFSSAPCGFDIQEAEPDNERSRARRDRIAKRWYSSADAAASAGDERTFFRIWARREAYVKALGGSVMMKTPDVNGAPKIVTDGGGHSWLIQDVDFPGGLYSAACTAAGDEQAEKGNFRILELEI